MTTSEIKALLDETKAAIASFEPPLGPHALVYRLSSAIETLLARQAEPAASPWRFDVENAEFTDREEYLLEYTHPWWQLEPQANYRGTLYYVAKQDHFTHPCHGIITRDRILAFATINPPEVQG